MKRRGGRRRKRKSVDLIRLARSFGYSTSTVQYCYELYCTVLCVMVCALPIIVNLKERRRKY